MEVATRSPTKGNETTWLKPHKCSGVVALSGSFNIQILSASSLWECTICWRKGWRQGLRQACSLKPQRAWNDGKVNEEQLLVPEALNDASKTSEEARIRPITQNSKSSHRMGQVEDTIGKPSLFCSISSLEHLHIWILTLPTFIVVHAREIVFSSSPNGWQSVDSVERRRIVELWIGVHSQAVDWFLNYLELYHMCHSGSYHWFRSALYSNLIRNPDFAILEYLHRKTESFVRMNHL